MTLLLEDFAQVVLPAEGVPAQHAQLGRQPLRQLVDAELVREARLDDRLGLALG